SKCTAHRAAGRAPRRNAIIAIKRLFNWAVQEAGVLPHNPLQSIRKPPKRKQNRILTPAERAFVCQAIKDEFFRQFVFAMLETGCRPSEVRQVTAAHVSGDFSRWVFHDPKTDPHTPHARTLY